jgi:hypothetical protein
MQPDGLGKSWARHLTCVPTDRLPKKCLRLSAPMGVPKGVPTALVGVGLTGRSLMARPKVDVLGLSDTTRLGGCRVT